MELKKYKYLVFPAVNLKKGDSPFTIDFISWRVSEIAFCLVTSKTSSYSTSKFKLLLTNLTNLNYTGKDHMTIVRY